MQNQTSQLFIGHIARKWWHSKNWWWSFPLRSKGHPLGICSGTKEVSESWKQLGTCCHFNPHISSVIDTKPSKTPKSYCSALWLAKWVTFQFKFGKKQVTKNKTGCRCLQVFLSLLSIREIHPSHCFSSKKFLFTADASSSWCFAIVSLFSCHRCWLLPALADMNNPTMTNCKLSGLNFIFLE